MSGTFALRVKRIGDIRRRESNGPLGAVGESDHIVKTYIVALLATFAFAFDASSAERPNVVLILADDLGYGHLGCYGQTKIKTPHLDRLAASGMRFTDAYAGATVCAPSRCALMTGLHCGHARVRGNGGAINKGGVPLLTEDVAVAEVFKNAGYTTGLVGKWGLGDPGTTGIPTKKGFDFFYGFLNQTHAHDYFPDYLWRNTTKEAIDNPRSATVGVTAKENVYAPDRMLAEATTFLEANKAKPFFLCFTTTLPHANNERTKATGNGNEIPSNKPYADEPWPAAEKNLAAMITRMDADVGAIVAKLAELQLTEKTLILFSSDNGPHKEGGNDPEFFQASGPFTGIKRSLKDGGIRVPFIASWPGRVQAGSTSKHVTAFWDFLPTIAELVGQPEPAKLDGLSILPTLTGRGEQKTHEFLYWEFHENGFVQAARRGPWKGHRAAPGAALQLFNVVADPKESRDVAADHPEVAAEIDAYLKTARTDSAEFPIRPAKAKK